MVARNRLKRSAADKLQKFMSGLSEDERKKVWNIFHRQMNKE